jgi:hypothetical protein
MFRTLFGYILSVENIMYLRSKLIAIALCLRGQRAEGRGQRLQTLAHREAASRNRPNLVIITLSTRLNSSFRTLLLSRTSSRS